jgi:hypothetical protein
MKARTSPTRREPIRFAIAGRVTAWDPSDQRLHIGPYTLWVVRSTAVAGVSPGVEVSVAGYFAPPLSPESSQDSNGTPAPRRDPPARWIVTQLTLARPKPRAQTGLS